MQDDIGRLEIDLGALDANLDAIRGILATDCRVCAVVKADAYGLGAVQIARRLASRNVPMLAVYNLDQASELVRSAVTSDLLVLMPVENMDRTDVLYRTAVAGKLHLTVYSERQLDRIEAIGHKFGTPMRVHLEVDTGMSRGGMDREACGRILTDLPNRRYLKLTGVFTHPAAADDDPDFTNEQLRRFDELLTRHADAIGDDVAVHFANTYAALRDRAAHKKFVRIGLGLFGYGQDDLAAGPVIGEMPALRPVLRWISRIVNVQHVPAGTSVGYNRTYTTERDSRLGIAPVGYADGYPLALSNKSVVRVGDSLAEAPIRGKVNMDQLIIDLTDLPDADVDTPVELVSNDPSAPNALPRLAALAGSNCYEMLCRLSARLTRRYVTTSSPSGQPRHVATV